MDFLRWCYLFCLTHYFLPVSLKSLNPDHETRQQLPPFFSSCTLPFLPLPTRRRQHENQDRQHIISHIVSCRQKEHLRDESALGSIWLTSIIFAKVVVNSLLKEKDRKKEIERKNKVNISFYCNGVRKHSLDVITVTGESKFCHYDALNSLFFFQFCFLKMSFLFCLSLSLYFPLRLFNTNT